MSPQPPFTYFGAKTRLASRIVDLLPTHDHYVEPFCGSLAVLLAKPRSQMETVNDLDHYLVTFWRVLRDEPEQLLRACQLTPHSRSEQALSRNLEGLGDIEVARLVWVALTQGRNGKLRPTGWRFFRDAQVGSSMPEYLRGYIDRIPEAAERLAGVTLECRPALDVIRDYGQNSGTLVYADPPYLASTRGWGNNYRIEMRQDAEHIELAEALHACTGPVVLSGYASDLYDRELYADWCRIEMKASTGNGGTARDRTEVLWANRPLGADHLFSEEVS